MESGKDGQAAGMASKAGKGEARGSFCLKVLINQGFPSVSTLQFNLAVEAELIQAIESRKLPPK